MDTSEILTPENVNAAALVLQALDIESEKHYASKQNEIRNAVKIADHEVSEMAEEFNMTAPSQIIMMNGHGYRMTYSLLVNLLKTFNRQDLCMVVLEAKLHEGS